MTRRPRPVRYSQPDPRPALAIANQYLQGELLADRAATRLAEGNPFGRFLAGEVLLDQVTKDPTSVVAGHLSRAKEHFTAVVQQTDNGLWQDGYDHAGSRGRAMFRIAQLGVYHSLYAQKVMPKRPAVEAAYRKVLGTAVQVNHHRSKNFQDRITSALDLRGVIGEMAVLLLAQRYALHTEISDEWLPLQSSFSEDHGGNCLADTGAYAWDMNVFAPTGERDLPTRVQSLQVRYANSGSAPTLGPTVHISPDLAMYPGEKFVAEAIINECNFEMQSPERAARLTENLDTRTERLLNILG